MDDISSTIRARISYAFRVFAAIYNYRVVEAESDKSAICFAYGGDPPPKRNSTCFHVPARYNPGSSWVKQTKLAKHYYAGEELPLFYGLEETTGNPDWLGEIFTWVSSSHELCISKRDSIGRVAYEDMIFSRHRTSPRKPYATILMAWMENVLRNGNGGQALPRAESPITDCDHAVVCSQDIDFYHIHAASTLARLVKNLGIAALQTQSWSFFSSSLLLMAKTLIGRRVGDYLPPMMERMKNSGIQSTLFVVPRQAHRRDPNYRLKQLLARLSEASGQGFSVELHGSYTSIVSGETLAQESSELANAMGKNTLGGRQHWLRFSDHGRFFQAVEDTGLMFDSTMGFADMVGFRNGASFAFPPYDFKREKPHAFLEIPLVLMDGALEAASRTLKRSPRELAEEVLQQSRKWAWGGISILWHNPMEPVQVSKEINEVFWRCAPKQGSGAERWMNTSQFIEQCRERYQNAGLLRETHCGSKNITAELAPGLSPMATN